MKKRLLFFVALLALPFTTYTYSVSNKFYVGFGAGIISPNDVDIDIAAGTYDGVTFSGGILLVNLSLIMVFKLTGLLGYRFNDYLSFETELGYTNLIMINLI